MKNPRTFEAPCYYKRLHQKQKETIGKIMTQLGCDDYDRHDDMSKLTIKITETLEMNKIKWKEFDDEKVKLIIRN